MSADLDIDVAVIGAGYTGLSTAYHLKARHGITATVVEAHRIGWGCSGRNGGFAMIGVGKDSHASWIRRFGLAEARRAFEFGRDAVRTLRTVLEEARIESASGNEGFLYVAHRPSRVAELVAMQRQLKQYFGFETELIGCDALRQEYLNGAQLHGALHYPEHFPIHPMRYVQALGKAVKALGVPVHENSPVRQWERVGDRHVLRTPAGSLRAKRVVIATNAYTPDRLHPLVQGKLMNVLSNIIVTVPLTADQRAATNWRTHKMLVDTRHLRFYWRLLEDERILFGARGGIEDTPASRAAMRLWMHEQLLARFRAWDPSMSTTSGRDGWRSPVTRDRISAWPTTAPSPTRWDTPEPAWQCPPIAASCWPTRWRAARPSTFPPWWARPFLRSKSRRYASSINARHTATSTSRTNTCEQGKHAHGHPDHPSKRNRRRLGERRPRRPADVGTALPSQVRDTPDPGKAHVRTGLWECSLGKFRREIAEGEVMHILTGRCTFTPDSAPMIELRAGDTAFFPPDTRGIWEILRTVRKVYVLF